MSYARPQEVPLPSESQISAVYVCPNLADAFAIDLPRGSIRDPEALARFIFARQPRWVAASMTVRDTLVGAFRLKTGRSLRSAAQRGGRIGIFKVYASNSLEVIMGEDDKHLNFRASVLYRAQEEGSAAPASLVLSTVVNCHNRLGRTYLALISPLHRLVVQSFLRRAAKIGWPTGDGAASLGASRCAV